MKRVLLLLAIAATAGVLLAWLTLSHLRSAPSTRLPDGTELWVVGTTWGRVHEDPKAGIRQRLARHAPPVIRRLLNTRAPLRIPTPQDELVVWLRWSGPAWPHDHRWVLVVDASNYPLSPGTGTDIFQTPIYDPKTRQGHLALKIRAYPKRDKLLRLVVIDPTKTPDTGTPSPVICFDNPRVSTVPPFPAGGIGDWQTNGPLALRLAECLAAVSFDVGRSDPGQGTRLRFEVSAGTQRAGWRLVRLLIEDATGNEARAHSWRQVDDDAMTYETPAALFPDEPWRVTAGFVRTKSLPSDQVWAPLPLPADEKDLGERKQLTATLGQYQVELLGISDRQGKFADGTRASLGGQMLPSLELRVSPPLTEGTLHLDLAEVEDDHGRSVAVRAQASRAGSQYGFLLDLPRNTLQIHPRISLQPVHEFSFVVQPRRRPSEPEAPGG